jgi:hypothetical protein
MIVNAPAFQASVAESSVTLSPAGSARMAVRKIGLQVVTAPLTGAPEALYAPILFSHKGE